MFKLFASQISLENLKYSCEKVKIELENNKLSCFLTVQANEFLYYYGQNSFALINKQIDVVKVQSIKFQPSTSPECQQCLAVTCLGNTYIYDAQTIFAVFGKEIVPVHSFQQNDHFICLFVQDQILYACFRHQFEFGFRTINVQNGNETQNQYVEYFQFADKTVVTSRQQQQQIFQLESFKSMLITCVKKVGFIYHFNGLIVLCFSGYIMIINMLNFKIMKDHYDEFGIQSWKHQMGFIQYKQFEELLEVCEYGVTFPKKTCDKYFENFTESRNNYLREFYQRQRQLNKMGLKQVFSCTIGMLNILGMITRIYEKIEVLKNQNEFNVKNVSRLIQQLQIIICQIE